MDDNYLFVYIIKCLFEEFDPEYDQLLDSVIDKWFESHPSPSTQSSKCMHSPTVDNILFSKIKEQCGCVMKTFHFDIVFFYLLCLANI